MVRIVNPLGDVKIGKQGQVVYQRKYGQQIRRMAQPKRAIASEAQIAHRQLYKAALDWRKQLSRANRRYLEGYCIANGVVDNYHIPLPWSRFALKLYLEKVGFVVITKPIAGAAGEKQLYEHYNGASTASTYFLSDAWRAQGFTTDPEGEYYEILLGDGTDLEASTKYAIVMRQTGLNSSNCAWLHFSNLNPYTDGSYCYSPDAGQSWTINDPVDFCFEEYGAGEPEAGQLGLIHVRHPALLTVIHRRGELISNGYGNLSSLDDEYLTKQVGLDVEVGDSIEATTLPGITYKREVL